jgi:DnaJ-class molecular chaperone
MSSVTTFIIEVLANAGYFIPYTEGVNPYRVLGINKDSDEAEIKAAYRKLIKKYHPDRESGDEERFREVQEAYEILSDPARRQEYEREDPFQAWQDLAPRSLWEFAENGESVYNELTIPWKLVYTGGLTRMRGYKYKICDTCQGYGEIEAYAGPCRLCRGTGHGPDTLGRSGICRLCLGTGRERPQKCPTCLGSGVSVNDHTYRVKIPAGVKPGQMLRLPGKGRPGRGGGLPGDLIVRIHYEDDPMWSYQEGRYQALAWVDPVTALLGGKAQLSRPDGKLVTFRVPPGSADNKLVRLADQGPGGNSLYIELRYQWPQKLSRRQRKALQSYLDQEKDEPS